MFQFWKLVLLCGLLTGTSASLLGDLGNNLKDVLDKGPGVITDIAESESVRLVIGGTQDPAS